MSAHIHLARSICRPSPRAAARIPHRLGTCGGSRSLRDSAFRLVRQLRQEGFLDRNDKPLRLVRRKELLRRWQAAHLRGAPEVPCVGSFRPRASASYRRRFAPILFSPT